MSPGWAERHFVVLVRDGGSGPIPQVGLHVLVVADEIAAQQACHHVEHHAQAKPGANFVKTRGQPAEGHATVRVRVSPALRQRTQHEIDGIGFAGSQLAGEADEAFRQHEPRRRRRCGYRR